MFTRWPRPSFYAVLVLVLIVDQLTKFWAVAVLTHTPRVTLIPGFFNLTYVENPGIAFGMFAGKGLLVALFVIVLAGVALYYSRSVNWTGWEPNVLGGCLCGGALGNLIDRSRLGYVVDFFHVYHHAWRFDWPVFNVADSVICVTVGWIVLRQFYPAK